MAEQQCTQRGNATIYRQKPYLPVFRPSSLTEKDMADRHFYFLLMQGHCRLNEQFDLDTTLTCTLPLHVLPSLRS